MVHNIKRGLDLKLEGPPVQEIVAGPPIGSVALLGDDYIGMRPTMLVQEGEDVRLGQPVFSDKKTEGIVYTAPGAGVVRSINRGAKRKFESLVIELDGDDQETALDRTRWKTLPLGHRTDARPRSAQTRG